MRAGNGYPGARIGRVDNTDDDGYAVLNRAPGNHVALPPESVRHAETGMPSNRRSSIAADSTSGLRG